MPPKEKIPTWEYVYSICALVIASLVGYFLWDSPQLTEYKYRYIIIVIIVISLIVIAERIFLRIRKIKEDGNNKRR